jgi:hypothetical protein
MYFCHLTSNQKTRENSLKSSREICFSKKNFQKVFLWKKLDDFTDKKSILCDWLMRGAFFAIYASRYSWNFAKWLFHSSLLILWILFGIKKFEKNKLLNLRNPWSQFGEPPLHIFIFVIRYKKTKVKKRGGQVKKWLPNLTTR